MVMTQYGIKYAVHIITAHFGNLVAKVCETLLRRGPLTLRLLIRFTELTSSQVNNSLLILIQHNCVQAFTAVTEGEFGDAPKADTQYLALFSNVLHRMRFSKFLAIASEKLRKDKDCEELLEGLLQNGRLSMEQMVERAQSSKHAGNRPIPDIVHDSLFKLLNAHFVERCPAPEPSLSPKVEEQPPPKKRGAKAAKISEVPETLEQRVVESARPMEVLRFSMGDTNTEAEKSEHYSQISGQKRKHDDLEMVQDSGDADSVILWRANFDEFIRCLRHKACIEHVRSQFDDGVVNVLSAILEATRSSEKIVKTEITVPLSLDNIYEEVMKNEVGRSMTLDRVEASLSSLGCPGMDDYQINLRKIIEQAQIDEVESIVLKRYGRDAYRMFRFLSKTGGLVETEKISDSSFVDKNEAPKILYRLWKDEYLYMEKVALTVPRHSLCLLWRVDRYNLWEHVLDEMYHASLNLQLRQAYEMEENKELLSLPPDNRNEPLMKRFDRLKKVRGLLQSSLLKLDDALMLFHDF
ncbi:DNA-directed RNA polymerase III subunit RPC3 isoform X1 [Benincasa hispida]|uniref:DNA-directed RNA polymerase III subunit RPC3 isoform X1 n=2 Tax=Benincasa hispida TaxID=102211 RepID=UPI001901F4DD|nr:DNA-directed RNA polymerase III subunit RPC3 isoform X1 [Benincasa hispida]XP_038878062.1 DNA-directed RNA polymerase III subunit RPC3 isoform X1 [Benincasa hispida]